MDTTISPSPFTPIYETSRDAHQAQYLEKFKDLPRFRFGDQTRKSVSALMAEARNALVNGKAQIFRRAMNNPAELLYQQGKKDGVYLARIALLDHYSSALSEEEQAAYLVTHPNFKEVIDSAYETPEPPSHDLMERVMKASNALLGSYMERVGEKAGAMSEKAWRNGLWLLLTGLHYTERVGEHGKQLMNATCNDPTISFLLELQAMNKARLLPMDKGESPENWADRVNTYKNAAVGVRNIP